MSYAITYKQEGIENPAYIFENASDVSKAWFNRHHGGTSSLDMVIQDDNGQDYEAGFDGGYFLNKLH